MIEVDHGKLSYVGDHTQYEKESQFYLNFLENLANKTKEEDSAGEKVLGEDSAVAKVGIVFYISEIKGLNCDNGCIPTVQPIKSLLSCSQIIP